MRRQSGLEQLVSGASVVNKYGWSGAAAGAYAEMLTPTAGGAAWRPVTVATSVTWKHEVIGILADADYGALTLTAKTRELLALDADGKGAAGDEKGASGVRCRLDLRMAAILAGRELGHAAIGEWLNDCPAPADSDGYLEWSTRFAGSGERLVA